jgi:hypothetical protein
MRRSWKALIVAAAVLLGTLGVMSLASASTDNTTVLHITGKILQTQFLDLGKKGLNSARFLGQMSCQVDHAAAA